MTVTGLTLVGMSERAILVYDNYTVELEDVVLTGGTAGVYVDHNGGELIADELRIVDNILGTQLALLECSGTCTLTGSQMSRNDDDNIIKMGPQAHLRLIDTEIEDNTPTLHVIDVRGGRLDMDGGSLAWNEGNHTTVDASCSANSGGQRGRVQATASIGGNVSEDLGRLLYCGCDGDTAWVHNYSSPSTRTLSCD